MSNNRKAIRAAVKTMLLNNTSAGENVYTNRETTTWESELPAILIYSDDENATNRDITGRQKIRTYNVRIEIKAEAEASVDDDLDDLAQEIETILNADRSLSGTAMDSNYTSTSISISSEGDKEIGTVLLNYEIKYIG